METQDASPTLLSRAKEAIGLVGSLTEVAAFDHQVTGVAIAEDGRRFVDFPRWTDDAPISVAEVMEDGTLEPYPDDKWNSWRNAKAHDMPVGDYFVCVQSIVPDGHGNLWVLDPGAPGNEKILPGAPKLVRIDLGSDEVTKVIPVPEDVALQGTYLNDIRFSPDGKTGYVTDSGTRGAIIIVDLESGDSWRALDGHFSTQVDKSVTVAIEGEPLRRPDGRQAAYEAMRVSYFDDVMTFRPAHSLAAHRPLGGVMRARLQVYKALSAFRHRENGIDEQNTGSVDQIPA